MKTPLQAKLLAALREGRLAAPGETLLVLPDDSYVPPEKDEDEDENEDDGFAYQDGDEDIEAPEFEYLDQD